jgi:hypothetical protein
MSLHPIFPQVSLFRFAAAIAVSYAASFVPNAFGESASGTRQSNGPRLTSVCGPQCLKWVLHHYGHSVPLEQLIQETQWPDLENGASVRSLEEALARRKIYSVCLASPDGFIPAWPGPIIALLRNSDQQLGHYVVALPAPQKGSRIQIWDPAQGTTQPLGTDSPIIALILTSDQPLALDDKFPDTTLSSVWLIYAMVAAGIAAIIPLALYRRQRAIR